ncbi:MAG: hypothetical protein HWN80_18340 [Candidatus Lokiarchaeota archaeon]|nr:hypothetical protein [Candidatus Lokiarchaeota archaeon]
MKNGVIVIPKFKITKTGRVFCKKHSLYNKNESEFFPDNDLFRIFRGEGPLRCENCSHYKNDDCYFTKSDIDKIRKDLGVFRRRYKCDVCKSKITFLSNVLHKLYSEQYNNYKISLICCACYGILQQHQEKTLKNQEIPKTGYKSSLALTIPIILSLVVFTYNAFFSIDVFLKNIIPILLFIVPTTICYCYFPLKLSQRTRKRKNWLKNSNFYSEE